MEDREKAVQNDEPETAKAEKRQEKKIGSKMSENQKYFLVGAIVLVFFVFLLFGLAFFGYFDHRGFRGGNKAVMMERNFDSFNHRGFVGRGDGMRQDSVTGKVTTVNGQAFTLDVNGQLKNVQISDLTRFPLNSATSVKTGDTVTVWGQQDSKSVIQATRIVVKSQ
jgi:hypothetical protein